MRKQPAFVMRRARALRRRLLAATFGLAGLLGLVGLMAPGVASAQADGAPAELTGTLKKLRETGSITLAHRLDSVPFSYLSPAGQPIGYTVDLCLLLAQAIGEQLGRELQVRWLPVTAANRIEAITSGQADLECGSTTSNVERQRVVAFSPTLFVAGTKLLVKRSSGLQQFRDLARRNVAVTAGTTNEKALRDLAKRFQVDVSLVPAPDHEAALALLTSGQVDAFGTDDVLLHGLIARHQLARQYRVVGDYLSYDPYAVMFRKGDAPLARAVDEGLRALAQDGEIERRYQRWFLQKLPGGGPSLGLPMSAQLESALGALAFRRE